MIETADVACGPRRPAQVVDRIEDSGDDPYLSGEFSAWLGDLGRQTTDPGDAARLAELRVLSERCAPNDLAR
jgi:hypothetical protein